MIVGFKEPHREGAFFLGTPQIPVLWLVENRKGLIHPCIVAEKGIVRYAFILYFPEIKTLIATDYNPHFKNVPSKANVQV